MRPGYTLSRKLDGHASPSARFQGLSLKFNGLWSKYDWEPGHARRTFFNNNPSFSAHIPFEVFSCLRTADPVLTGLLRRLHDETR